MKRSRTYTFHTQCSEPGTHLPGRFVGESDGEHLRGVERSRRHLMCDAPGDRRRFSRSGTGQDAHGAADAFDCAQLLRIEVREDG
jgi:hypothetical protein